MQTIITTSLYLLSVFIPLTFTTLNLELFEFPKFIILLSGTLVILVAWAIHFYQTRQLTIKLNLAHLSVLAVLATQTLSTFFSIHPYTSFWGYYSRFHQGLLTTFCYTIIYFAAVTWLDKKSTLKLIKIIVGTSFFVGIYAVLERFGIDKNFWVQDVQNRVFSTLGQPNWLAAYVIPNLFLTLYLSRTSKAKDTLIYQGLFALLFITLLFTKSRSGFIGFTLSYLAYWLLLMRQFGYAKIKRSLISFSLIALVPILIFGTPYTPALSSLKSNSVAPTPSQGTVLENGGTESGDIRKIVWSGALNLIRRYPLFGTGPETFAYTYYWERPTAHNLTSEWDFLYNKAHNEYLNIAAGTGILGLLAYLAWHFSLFASSLTRIPKTKKIAQEKEDLLRNFYPVLGASVIAFTVTNFFGFSVIPVYYLMIMLAAASFSLAKEPQDASDFSPFYALIVLLPLIYTTNLFLADTNYARGKQYLDAGQIGTSIPYLQKASHARPGLDLYHSTLGEAYAAAGQKDLALQELETNRRQNPYHLNYYKSRGKIYLTLASVDPSFNNQAATELEQARKLAPTDPKLAYNLGLIYTRLSDAKNAETHLRAAIDLKPNYAEPYYALTLLYEQTKQTAAIPDLLKMAKTNLATYSAQLKEKIDKYTNLN
jgi:O-antigen ligase